MAVLRLELDIDPDVHPVLYARLQRLQSVTGRAECVRQLATSGLMWETLRLQATPLEPESPAAAAADGDARRRTPSAPPRLRDPGFIDLAIDSMDSRAHDDAGERPAHDSPPPGHSRLPVLDEVVLQLPGSVPFASPRDDDDAVIAPPSADRPAHAVPPMAKPRAPRSRLLRMKERGLFSNG